MDNVRIYEGMLPSYDGTKLYTKKEIPENPEGVVVIVHGLCEHQGRYDNLAGYLNRHGYATYRFDHRGHGLSEGKRVFFNSFREMGEDVNTVFESAGRENNGLPVFVIGHSMGGMATAIFATLYPGKGSGIILSGARTGFQEPEVENSLPVDGDPGTYMELKLGDRISSDPRVRNAYQEDPLVEKQVSVGLRNCIWQGVRWIKKHTGSFITPVLILHGNGDLIVSERNSIDFYSGIGSKDKSLKLYANLYHEIFNEPCKDMVYAEVVRWIKQHI